MYCSVYYIKKVVLPRKNTAVNSDTFHYTRLHVRSWIITHVSLLILLVTRTSIKFGNLALMHLYDKLSSAIDQREYTMDILIDLSKAFDAVNHEILFNKLEHYGVEGIALKWFKSYLSNRLQFVHFNGHCSSSNIITSVWCSTRFYFGTATILIVYKWYLQCF